MLPSYVHRLSNRSRESAGVEEMRERAGELLEEVAASAVQIP